MKHQNCNSIRNMFSNLQGEDSKSRIKWEVEYHFYLSDPRWDASSVETISSCSLFDWSPRHPGYLTVKCRFFAQGPFQALKEAKRKAKDIQEDFKQWPLDDYQIVRVMADFSDMVMDSTENVEAKHQLSSP